MKKPQGKGFIACAVCLEPLLLIGVRKLAKGAHKEVGGFILGEEKEEAFL